MKHYVYTLIDPRSNDPFYVGAGSGATTNKRLQDHIGEAKSGKTSNHDKCKVINELLTQGLKPLIAVHECIDATHAATTEKEMIKQYGMKKDGGILTNRHPGGGGIKGAGKAGNKNGRLPPKSVYQFDLDGNLIKCWPAVTQAARGIGVSHTAIISACKGVKNTKTVGGYQWSYSDQPLAKVTKDDRAVRTVYEQYDMNDNLIATFESGRQMLTLTGVDPSSVRRFIRGETRHAGGFKWKIRKEGG